MNHPGKRRIESLGERDSRSMLIAVGVLVLGILIVLGVFVLAVPSLTRSGKVEVRLGSNMFDAGSASKRASTIAEGGPLLFSDVASGNRDIWLQHLGTSDTEGWLAFDARRPGTSRDCTLDWDAVQNAFVDPCDGSVIPADGAGLTHYEVTVNENDHVLINLRDSGSTSEGSIPAEAPLPGEDHDR